MAQSHAEKTIFVSIPSYRDPECQYTIRDLFLKAAHPKRIFVGVCWQADEEEDKRCFLLDLSEYSDRVRTKFLHHSQARGPCVARALIEQELYKGEDYYLQLDSHYRMIPNWDEELITQLHLCGSDKDDGSNCSTNNAESDHSNNSRLHRAILTSYPSSYTLPDDYEPGGADRATLNADRNPILLCAKSFAEDSFLRIVGKALKPEESHTASEPTAGGQDPEQLEDKHQPSTSSRQRWPKRPKISRFWAAGLAFSSGKVLQEVPYDPSLEDLFFGEEPCMAARLWTSGWDFYAPTCIVGYHLWTRRHRPFFREHASEERKQREAAARTRVRRLLGMETDPEVVAGEFGRYGLGSRRSLDEWEDFTGVSHRKQEMSLAARRGGQPPSVFIRGDPAAAADPSSSAAGSGSSNDPAKLLANLLAGSGFLAAPSPSPSPLPSGPGQAEECRSEGASEARSAEKDGVAAESTSSAPPSSTFGSLPMFGAMPANVAAAIQAMAGAPAPAARAESSKPPRLLDDTLPCDFRDRFKLLTSDNLDMLNKYGITVVDGLLSARSYGHLGERVAARAPEVVLRGAQQVPLRGAGLGAGDRVWSSTAVRGDEMTWLPAPNREGLQSRVEQHLEAASASASAELGVAEKDQASLPLPSAGTESEASEKAVNTESSYFQDLEVLLSTLGHLAEELDLLSFKVQRSSTMLARYPGQGARYARHLDAARDRPAGARRLTAVYYLNQQWSPEKGGCLRAFLPKALGPEASKALQSIGVEAASSSVDADPGLLALDVEPRFDRLVLFASSWLEHEVLPVFGERYAITTWFY